MITAVPGATAVARPAVLIVAINTVLDAQVTEFLVMFCVELSVYVASRRELLR